MPNLKINSFDKKIIEMLLQVNEAAGDMNIPTAPSVGDAPSGPPGLTTGEMPAPMDATTPIADVEEEPEDKTPTPESVIFLINLIKKAFWLDPSTVELSDFQTNLLTKKVTSKNAEKMLEVLKKIIGDAGLLQEPNPTPEVEERDE